MPRPVSSVEGQPGVVITGCDEHGLKIQTHAEASLVSSPQAHCDQVSAITYASSGNAGTISNDRAFIRTTDSSPTGRLFEQFYRRG